MVGVNTMEESYVSLEKNGPHANVWAQIGSLYLQYEERHGDLGEGECWGTIPVDLGGI